MAWNGPLFYFKAQRGFLDPEFERLFAEKPDLPRTRIMPVLGCC